MRALLERSRPARFTVVMLALAIVLPLMRGAAAGDDPGLRRAEFWSDEPPAAQDIVVQSLPQPRQRHRHARRIWAASRSRPLRVELTRRKRVATLHRRGAKILVARRRLPVEPPVVFPKLVILPKPPRSALVSIYQDRTLRDGDAVMMADGIHVYHGLGEWPHQPRDFVRLTFVAALDWRLRRTLDALDKNPPPRWSSLPSGAA